MAGPLDPIEHVTPGRGPEESPGVQGSASPHRRVLRGEIVAVHRKTGHADAGGHVLDTTVGEQAHDELVVRVDGGDVSGLVGERVVINIHSHE